MSERMFFRSHSASKIAAFDHAIKVGHIVGHSIGEGNEIWWKPK